MENPAYHYYRIDRLEDLRACEREGIRLLDWDADFALIEEYYQRAFGVTDLSKDAGPDAYELIAAVALTEESSIVSFALILNIRAGEWEIGAVSTAPRERNKGCCKAVLCAAARFILEHQKAAALTTRGDNLAMRRAAEAIGMKRHFRE